MLADKMMRLVITLYGNNDLFKQQAVILKFKCKSIDERDRTYNGRK